MAKMYKRVWFGKELVDEDSASLSIASSAVLYGLGVYTVFPVCIGEKGEKFAFRLDEHFKRLKNSARIIGIDGFEEKWTYPKFEAACRKLIDVNSVNKDVFVRATIHVSSEIAGTRSRGLGTLLSIFVYDAVPILPQDGARLKTSVWRRIPDFAIPSRAKVNGAYVNSVLAKQDALDSGYDDCIFLDSHGHVCELSAANIFLIRHEELITPDTTSDLLEGINRKSIIQIAREEFGIKVRERQVDLTELYVADEVFATGTSALVAPITEIDGRKVGHGKLGDIALKIQKLHSDILHGRSAKHRNWLTKL